MPWILRDEELKAVLSLDGPKRYEYTIKKVADQEQVWSLWKDDGWALTGDSASRELVPVWPHERFASLCATGIWIGYEPKMIAIDVWIERWIPGIENDGRSIAVFPTPEGRGVAVDPRRFETDLRDELSQYE